MSGWFVPAASSSGIEVDHLFWALLAISTAVMALVFGLMALYVVRYRAGSPIDRGSLAEKSWVFEIAWTSATLLVFLGLFVWGADLYVRLYQPPGGALKLNVVGKQWMWKIEHPAGQREINALHIPVDTPIELIMTSEDVIHDFAIPAFRVKHDVLPGRYETLWFQATRTGDFHLFCTQFCGTDHAAMIGEVDVMTQPDYQHWLDAEAPAETLAAAGAELFRRYGCSGCHEGGSTAKAPVLDGLYGSPVPLEDGRMVTADDRYLRDAIIQPDGERVAGFAPLMPSYAGQIGEEDLFELIAYLKSRAPAKEQP
ncbi:MAG TPA: cytochrome c oxidase subunit II [Aliidongia sp.]|uniref:cytochrome c oxidase subunit II n=1 Tax=Aliidongia sp. TaxID=1914230 RepID=UPI002DDD1158|nr:cytochrome c oxidase subunit II [Aliidongia sp.]HEV2673244.1 cytochrome c oxidase subunit II [Aliidongia sp.]